MNALANKNNSTSADLGADARRSDRVDFCAVGRVPRVGDELEPVRAGQIRTASGSDRVKDSTKTAGEGARGPREDRPDSAYVIDAVAKALKVFEALEGRRFEPVSVARVAQRTGFGRDFCFRALKTLKVAGYAKETLDGWILGPKAEALSRRLSASLLNQS